MMFPGNGFDAAPGQGRLNTPRDFTRAGELLQEAPNRVLLGPFNDNDAAIRARHSRHMILLPHCYTHLFLAGRVPLRQGFINLSTLMDAHGDTTSCPELTDLLLLSITCSGVVQGTPIRLPPPIVPLAQRCTNTDGGSWRDTFQATCRA